MTPLTKQLYFTTSTVIDWVDIFTRASYRHVIVESLDYCQRQKGLKIYAWVLMSNHLHMVVSAEGKQAIGDILRDFKKFTNKKILKVLEEDEHESRRAWMLDRFYFAGANDKRITNYRFWQEGNHVEEIYTSEFLWQKVNYIHLNPVRAEIVGRAEEYLYSSARNYAGEKGLLEVEVVRF
jgi:REP element-mobilizing transposase RayT